MHPKKDNIKHIRKKMNICICGGGALGHVVSGFLSSKPENRVSVLTRKPQLWSTTLHVTDPDGLCYEGHLAQVSSSPRDVIPGAQLVLLCLPGYSIKEELLTIRPHLTRGTCVGSIVSSTGFFFMAEDTLGDSFPLFGFQRVPFIARTCTYGHSANLLGYKPSLNLAVEHLADKEPLRQAVEHLFQRPTHLLASHYAASLTNSNPILHTARLYDLWKDWEPGVTYDRQPYFYRDWTEESSDTLIAMDNDFMHILDTLDLGADRIPSLLDYYESHDAASLANKIRSIPAFKNILAPMIHVGDQFAPDFDSRYFREDFPYGLSFILHVANSHHVPVPVLEKIFLWYQGIQNTKG
jgi:hypothetical protein